MRVKDICQKCLNAFHQIYVLLKKHLGKFQQALKDRVEWLGEKMIGPIEKGFEKADMATPAKGSL